MLFVATEDGGKEISQGVKASSPMVRVLLEMPEEDAMWLRTRLWQQRKQHENSRVPIATGEYYNHQAVHKSIEMHIREVLLYG